MNIILSGAPFSGKTTIGMELAQILRWPLINTDTLLEKKFGLSCPDQYKQFGNQKFRENENAILKEIINTPGKKVISLGGGALTDESNARIVKSLGLLVCLKCSFEELFQRLKMSGRTPAYLDPDNLEESYKKLLRDRESHYLQYADFLLDVTATSPLESALKIIQEYKDRYGQ